MLQTEDRHTPHVLLIHLGSSLQGCERTRSSVGHNVTAKAINIELRTNFGDLQSQLPWHLHIFQPGPSFDHQLLECIIRFGPLCFHFLRVLGPFIGPG
eukprot:Skav232596  [mRNA]  locus=scaffold2040:125912:129640:+ [translate_table: standard]